MHAPHLPECGVCISLNSSIVFTVDARSIIIPLLCPVTLEAGRHVFTFGNLLPLEGGKRKKGRRGERKEERERERERRGKRDEVLLTL